MSGESHELKEVPQIDECLSKSAIDSLLNRASSFCHNLYHHFLALPVKDRPVSVLFVCLAPRDPSVFFPTLYEAGSLPPIRRPPPIGSRGADAARHSGFGRHRDSQRPLYDLAYGHCPLDRLGLASLVLLLILPHSRCSLGRPPITTRPGRTNSSLTSRQPDAVATCDTSRTPHSSPSFHPLFGEALIHSACGKGRWYTEADGGHLTSEGETD